MSASRLRTVIIGFGRVGAGYADDPVMAKHYPYATHAQVLSDHPAFAWEAVVDPSDDALELARSRWGIGLAVHSTEELAELCRPEVAVIATSPESRMDIIDRLPGLRAVLVEKPLGRTTEEGRTFLEQCRGRGIKCQVNLWRRADQLFRRLALGRLREMIGEPQAAFGVYGNGVINNGTHMVDFVRMLLGEVEAIQTVEGAPPYHEGPLAGDSNIPFVLRLRSGLTVMMQPVSFRHFRENSLDIWGERGRLSIMQEGLGVYYYPRLQNRAMKDEWEIASDRPEFLDSTVGKAFYSMYSNLAEAVSGKAQLWSTGESALITAGLIEEITAMQRRRRGDHRTVL